MEDDIFKKKKQKIDEDIQKEPEHKIKVIEEIPMPAQDENKTFNAALEAIKKMKEQQNK